MAYWKLDVAAAQAVVQQAAAAAPATKPVIDAFDGLTAAVRGSAEVLAAVHRFAAQRAEVPARVEERVVLVIEAAGAVADAFIEGDAQMAAQIASAEQTTPVEAPVLRRGLQ